MSQASVTLTWPISQWPNPNRDRRLHWAVNAKRAKAIRASAKIAALQTMFTIAPLRSPVEVELMWAFPDRRPRDLENWSSKALLDGITDAGLIADDSSAHIARTVRTQDPERSPRGHLRVTVTITEIENGGA